MIQCFSEAEITQSDLSSLKAAAPACFTVIAKDVGCSSLLPSLSIYLESPEDARGNRFIVYSLCEKEIGINIKCKANISFSF